MDRFWAKADEVTETAMIAIMMSNIFFIVQNRFSEYLYRRHCLCY